MQKLLWISDLHFSEEPILGLDPGIRVQVAVEYINRHHSDALGCIISGDLTEKGSLSEYSALATLLNRLAIPWFPMVGNHDDRANLRAVIDLPDDSMSEFVQYRLKLGQATVLCLDTLKPGAADGELCSQRLSWVAAALGTADEGPCFVFQHHPPLALGLPVLDPDRLLDAGPLLELFSRNGAVQHLFFGHVHRPVSGVVKGVPFAGLRSLLIQAPPPEPAWNWDSFAPVHEAPEIGVIRFNRDYVAIQYVQPCGPVTGFVGNG